MVGFVFECAADLAEEEYVFEGGFAEEFLLVEDFRVGVGGAGGGDGGVAFFDIEEAEELGGIDDGEQVVDFKGEIIGEAVDVVASALVDE